ncbi:tRNA (guanosine(37)-N1)-methyltransferase TrmD [Candidatus Falkowbacteria bacterium]|jgi:tRNA (guanine37-N1)-methyltransferase|nr:tRNA (guanosine(37)-N1)-methyltransferase TrmD [Candidatus Falkowbacteria bacterium]MBT4432871.1 tRNA (guanosine(37)-N1)-methyltransferase TrmD [Candidatus Falkowbacteria bacterium]
MKFNILTIFPRLFDSFLQESLIKKSIDKKLIDFNVVNIRDFTVDKHKTVDDTSYGGGPGMVMKIEPIYKALKSIKKKKKSKIILLTPAGKQFNQNMAQEFSKLDELIFVCGRYEGIDARIDNFIDEKISIGSYVLNGGEIAAQVIIESVFRLIPGTLGNIKSLEEETFSITSNTNFEYPQYTRPEVFEVGNKKHKVPKILLSGDHKKIKEYRASH